MGSEIKWASYGGWSGPSVRGVCGYKPPSNPSGFDVIVAATARPEGTEYDIVNMYDGTAVTYGLLQWTFTSGRLHRLLTMTANRMGVERYMSWFGTSFREVSGLEVDTETSVLFLDGKVVSNYFKLRDACTPPGGKCPRMGKNWEKARTIGLLFSKLGEDPVAQAAQVEFFRRELMREINVKRPFMNGMTIAQYLYPKGWTGDVVEVAPGDSQELFDARTIMAARALFWAMWQNAPRKAEQYLDSVLRGFELPLHSRTALERLANKFAFSAYARWGVRKAKNHVDKKGKPAPYMSRYQKVAEVINAVMQEKLLPEYWKWATGW